MQQDVKLQADKVLQNDNQIDISVITVKKGSRRKENDHADSLHRHEQMELVYLLSGEMEATVALDSLFLTEGDLLIVKENVLHALRYSGNVTALVIRLNYENLAAEYQDVDIIFEQVVSGDSQIQEMLNDIYIEFCNKAEGYQLVCKGQITRLIVCLIRNYAQDVLRDKKAIRQRNKCVRLGEPLKYIDEHYAEPVKCKDLAEIIHLSEDRFQHLFKECMGVSVQKYINGVRMTKAERFLKSGMYSASEVAEMVGFQDYNSFGRIFRSTYGCAPSQIIRK